MANWDNPDNWVAELVAHAQSKRGPQIVSDYAAYECPVTGNMIEGRAAHRENLKRTGCRLYEKGETQDFIRNRERESARDTARLVDRMINNIAKDI